MHTLKFSFLLFVLVIAYLFPVQSFADCQGCCSSHDGVVCRNGITMCGDGTPLSITCTNKGCDECGTTPPPLPPTTDPNDIDNDLDGFTENQGDCNDYDRLEFPNQVWYKDFDNDGYSDGITIITCPRPENYKVISELYQTSGDINDNIPDPMLTHDPYIDSILPTSLKPNRNIVIRGKNFGSFQGSAYLSFANMIETQEILSWSDTQIECLVPLGIQSGCLYLKTNMGTSNCIQYEARQTLPWMMLLLSEQKGN